MNYNKSEVEFLIEIRQPAVCKNLMLLLYSIRGDSNISWKLYKDRLESIICGEDYEDNKLKYTHISSIKNSLNFNIKTFNPPCDFSGEKPEVINISFNSKKMNGALKNSNGKKDVIYIYKMTSKDLTFPKLNVYIDKTGSGVKPGSTFVDIIPSEIQNIPPINLTNLEPISSITTKILTEEVGKMNQCSKLLLKCYEKGISLQGLESSGTVAFFYVSPDWIDSYVNHTEHGYSYSCNFLSQSDLDSLEHGKIFQVVMSKKDAKTFSKLSAISGDYPQLDIYFIPNKMLLKSNISNSGEFYTIIEYSSDEL